MTIKTTGNLVGNALTTGAPTMPSPFQSFNSLNPYGEWQRIMRDLTANNAELKTKIGSMQRDLDRNEAVIQALKQIIENAMSANMKKTVKIETDATTGKVRVKRVRKFDASKARRIASSKTKRVVSPAKARAAR